MISVLPTDLGEISNPARRPEGQPVVDEAWLDAQVQQERMRQHMRGHAITAASGFLPIIYATWLLWSEVPVRDLLIWAVTLFLTDVVVVLHAVWFVRGGGQSRRSLTSWRLTQIGLQTLAAFLWGVLAIWVPVSDQVRTEVLVLLVAVMAIGVIGQIHYHLAVISYTTAIWLVTLVLSQLPEAGIRWQLLLGLLVALISLNVYLWESAAQLTRGLRLRFYGDALSHAYQEIAAAHHHAAIRDDLTGVYNRREGMRLLREIHEQVAGEPAAGEYTVILMDIDWFKRVNDTYGHLAGDDVLRTIADRVRGLLRPDDVLARIGGEEFLIVVPSPTDTEPTAGVPDPAPVPAKAAGQLAEQLLKAIQAAPIMTTVGPISVTASCGVAGSAGSASATDTLGRADGCLYAAKAAGRNRVHVATPAKPVETGHTVPLTEPE